MPPVVLAPFVKFKQFDLNGDPLSGGRLFSYQAGTSVPLATYADPTGTMPNTNPVILHDDGSAWVYLQAGVSYRLLQYDQHDVLQWSQDQVSGSGGAGSSGAICATQPIILQAVPGAAALVAAAAWQPGWRQIGVTADVVQAFGQSANLAQLAIGEAETFDRWGYCELPLASRTTAANFQSGDTPWTHQLTDVLVTPIGGGFDAAGQVALTLWYQDLGLPMSLPEPEAAPVPSTGGFWMTPPLVVLVTPGPAPLVAPGAWQTGWQQLGVICEVTQAFDTAAGLTGIAIGDAGQYDRWGIVSLTLGTTTTAADFHTGDQPWTTAPMDVLITPIGGAFGSTGQVRLTLHYLTLA